MEGFRPSKENAFHKPQEINNVRNAEADAQSDRSGGPSRHLRGRRRRGARRLGRDERHVRGDDRAWTAHPAGPQRSGLEPNQDLRRRRRRHSRLPMHRKGSLTDLSSVLCGPQPGTQARARVGVGPGTECHPAAPALPASTRRGRP